MENLSIEQVEELIAYYNQSVISESFNDDRSEFNVVIKNDSDFQKALQGAELAWYDAGEYPEPFTGKVITEDGGKHGAFEYKAPFGYYLD